MEKFKSTRTLKQFIDGDNERWANMTVLERLDQMIQYERDVVMPYLSGYLLGKPTRKLETLLAAKAEIIAMQMLISNLNVPKEPDS